MPLTVRQAAAILNVSERRVCSLIKDMRIKTRRIGVSHYLSRAQVERLKRRQRRPGPKGKP